MVIAVKLFGPAAQRVGAREVHVALDQDHATCRAIRAALAESAPAMGELLPASRFAVNHEFAGEDDPVRAGDEVALIGMVSGG